MNDEQIRLILAHELGHLVFNIENLKTPEILDNTPASIEEEQDAWLFAYYLVRTKSDEHKSNIRQNKFKYDDYVLKDKVVSLVKKKQPEILDMVIQHLKIRTS